MCRHVVWIIACAITSMIAPPPARCGSDFTLSADEVTIDPGGTAPVTVYLDNNDPVDAFQFGLQHDSALLTLVTIEAGSDIAALNGGAGADYLFTEIDPAGETGGVVGAVFSLSLPLESLPIGTQHEIAVLTYQGALGVSTSTAAALDLTEELGDPDIEVVVAVGSVGIVPAQTSGSVVFNPAPVEDLTCIPTSSCSLDYDIAWTNPTTYGSLRVFVDGVLDRSLIGIATSTSISFTSEGGHEVCIVGSFGTLESAPTCCSFVADPLPDPVDDLTCSVDRVTCLGTITWTNTEPYTSIEIYHDGALAETLAGDASVTTIATSGTPLELCVVPINACGAGSGACCTISCGISFIRGDCNQDLGFDIADAILGLDILFGGAAGSDCEDSCDANDDGLFDIADMIYILDVLFAMGPNPPAPYPDCGDDGTADGLGCTVGCP